MLNNKDRAEIIEAVALSNTNLLPSVTNLIHVHLSVRGQLSSKFSFGEVNCRLYGRNFRFMPTRYRSRKTQFATIKPTVYIRKWHLFFFVYFFFFFFFLQLSHPNSDALIHIFLSKCIILYRERRKTQDVNQWNVTLRKDVGFPTAYHRIIIILRRLTLSTTLYIFTCHWLSLDEAS